MRISRTSYDNVPDFPSHRMHLLLYFQHAAGACIPPGPRKKPLKMILWLPWNQKSLNSTADGIDTEDIHSKTNDIKLPDASDLQDMLNSIPWHAKLASRCCTWQRLPSSDTGFNYPNGCLLTSEV